MDTSCPDYVRISGLEGKASLLHCSPCSSPMGLCSRGRTPRPQAAKEGAQTPCNSRDLNCSSRSSPPVAQALPPLWDLPSIPDVFANPMARCAQGPLRAGRTRQCPESSGHPWWKRESRAFLGAFEGSQPAPHSPRRHVHSCQVAQGSAGEHSRVTSL